jgi:hypothetical protein
MVVKSADIMLYTDDGVSLGTIYSYFASKPYVEGQATYNLWKTVDYEWGTAGANNTGSVWNETDSGGHDRGSASQGSVACGWTWNTLPVDTAKINDWLRADSTTPDTANVPAWIVRGTGLQWFHSSEYPTDTAKTVRLRVILTPAATPQANNDFGADTVIKVDSAEQRSIMGFLGLREVLDGERLDSFVCSLYVQDTGTSNATVWLKRLDSTKSTAESDGTGGASNGCETNWNKYQVAGGGCSDSSWSTAGGDYYATVLDSLYNITTTGWTVRTINRYKKYVGGITDSLAEFEAANDTSCVHEIEDVLIELPNIADIAYVKIKMRGRCYDELVGKHQLWLHMCVSDSGVYDSTNISKRLGGGRHQPQIGSRPWLNIWSGTAGAWGTREFIFDVDRYQDQLDGHWDSTNGSWSFELPAMGQHSIKIDVWDAECDNLVNAEIEILEVWYVSKDSTRLIEYFQDVVDSNSIVDGGTVGGFRQQKGALILGNDDGNEELVIRSEDGGSQPKFWFYHHTFPAAPTWNFTLIDIDRGPVIHADSSGRGGKVLSESQ